MTTTVKTALFIGGAVIAYSLFRKGTAAGTLNFFPEKVYDLGFEGLTPVMTVGLGVQNTSNQSFTVNSIAGNLYANNYFAGNIGSFTPQTILPNSQKIILIKIRLQLIGVVNDIIKAYQTNNFSQAVVLKASVNVDNLQVPIEVKYNVGL